MHNRPVTALRKLACMQGNDGAVVYGECRDIDGHEVAGEPAWLMLRDKRDCPLCHACSLSLSRRMWNRGCFWV